MNIRIWIRIIGITGIVLASLSLITDATMLILTDFFVKLNSKGMADGPAWLKLKFFSGFGIHLISLIASIVFLKKLPYALPLMFASLILNMSYELIPFNPFGPIYVHVALFVGTYEIRKYYNLSEHDIRTMQGNNEVYFVLPERHIALSTMLSVIFISVPFILMLLWFRASSLGSDFNETLSIYHSFLPDVLTAHGRTSVVSILFCFCSVFFSVRSLKSKKVGIRLTNIILISLSGILLLMNLWSLM